MFKAFLGGLAALALLALPALPTRALAAPTFPPLTGRVVDNAAILPPQVQAQLTGQLAQLEAQTHHQVVVVTLRDLQGYEIEDYGYQLGRAWGIGGKAENDGVLLIVAPNQHKVRIEVGYGLEPVLTDALSSLIIQTQILPKFKAGDMPGGVAAGVNAIASQLTLPPDQAQTIAQNATAKAAATNRSGLPFSPLFVVIIIFFVLLSFGGRGGMGGALPWILLGALGNSGRRDSGGWGGGGGGGGFSGGGGSFGGGGASGSW